MSAAGRIPLSLVILLTVATSACPVLAIVSQDCARRRISDCTLAETARQAHVFIGAAVDTNNAPAERALVAEHFNAVTTENVLKWGSIAPTVGNYSFANADDIVDFAIENGLRLRGHTFLWGRLQLPSDLATLVNAAPDPAAALRSFITDHITTLTGRYGDRVDLWDVVNEPFEIAESDPVNFDSNIFFDTLGASYITDAFTLAHALNPDASLVLNEFSLSMPSDKVTALAALASDLLGDGVPIDGLGLQGHFFPGTVLPSVEDMTASFAVLASTGLPFEITELDVPISFFEDADDPFAAQADFFYDVVRACLSFELCTGITVWGIHDGDTWLDEAIGGDPTRPLLFDADLKPKPAYYGVRDAVAERAVSFWRQTRELRRNVRRAKKAGHLLPHSMHSAAVPLRKATRKFRRRNFPDGCALLGITHAVLLGAPGSAVPDLLKQIDRLAANLKCSEDVPPPYHTNRRAY